MKNQEFGARLRELRKKAGMSQRELARKISIDFTYLSKIESGVMPPPSEKVILRIGAVLSTDRDELLTLAGKIPADIAQILKNREARQLLRSDRTQKKIRAASNKKEGNGIMNNLFRYKYLSRAAIAVVLVCAVAAALWYATPTRALNVSFTALPSGTIGSTHSFNVKVNIPNPELVPIQSIDMEIYNVDDTAKKMTCTSLPLTNGGSGSYSTSGGTVSVTASTTNWQWFSGGGYADWKGTGYSWSPPNVTGYGYAAAGTASITYAGTWTSPSGWPSGGYKIKFTVNTTPATSPDSTQTFTDYSSQFTLSAPVFGGGVPSSTPPAPVSTDGKTYVAKVVTSEGRFTQDVTAKSGDGKVELDIPKDTIGKTEAGQRIASIDITPMTAPPAPPTGANIIGLTYNLGPAATFAPPIALTFTYDQSLIPAGVAEKDLVIAYYNNATGKWIELTTVVNTETNTLTATISHFTPFTILAKLPAPPTPPTPPTPPAPAPAVFTLSNLAVSPAEVKTGEAVTIKVSVANTGGREGSYTVTLKVNGLQEAEKGVTVSAGSSQTVTFSVTRTTAGRYSVDVNGLGASFTVTAPPAPPAQPELPAEVPEEVPAGIAWWVWLIVGIVAVAVIGVIIWRVARRRTA